MSQKDVQSHGDKMRRAKATQSRAGAASGGSCLSQGDFEHNKSTGDQENRKISQFLTIDNHEGVGVGGERSDPSPIPGWALLPVGLGRTGRDPEWGQAGFSPAGMGEGSLPRSSRWERRRRSRTPRARPRTAPPGSGNSCCPPVRGRGAWSGTKPPAPRSFPDLSWVFPDF